MSFELDELDRLIPYDLDYSKKQSLKESLKQFAKSHTGDKYYNGFYSNSKYEYFLQGDLIREIRTPVFDYTSKSYSKAYFDCILISNTCDMDEANKRNVSKQVLTTKIIPLKKYIEELDLLDVETKDKAEILTQIKNQQFSNLIYLPPIPNLDEDYIAFLDEISWITTDELSLLKKEIDSNRIATLDFFGYYLFILKISYHLLRLPEITHR